MKAIAHLIKSESHRILLCCLLLLCCMMTAYASDNSPAPASGVRSFYEIVTQFVHDSQWKDADDGKVSIQGRVGGESGYDPTLYKASDVKSGISIDAIKQFQEDMKQTQIKKVANDFSLNMLKDVLGTTGFAWLSGSSGLMGLLMTWFNLCLLVGASSIIAYTTLLGVMESSRQGALMTRQASNVDFFTLTRVMIGTSALVPSATGYSYAQIVLLWVVFQSVVLANNVWDIVVSQYYEEIAWLVPNSQADNFHTQPRELVSVPIDTTQSGALDLVSQMFLSTVCSQQLASEWSADGRYDTSKFSQAISQSSQSTFVLPYLQYAQSTETCNKVAPSCGTLNVVVRSSEIKKKYLLEWANYKAQLLQSFQGEINDLARDYLAGEASGASLHKDNALELKNIILGHGGADIDQYKQAVQAYRELYIKLNTIASNYAVALDAGKKELFKKGGVASRPPLEDWGGWASAGAMYGLLVQSPTQASFSAALVDARMSLQNNQVQDSINQKQLNIKTLLGNVNVLKNISAADLKSMKTEEVAAATDGKKNYGSCFTLDNKEHTDMCAFKTLVSGQFSSGNGGLTQLTAMFDKHQQSKVRDAVYAVLKNTKDTQAVMDEVSQANQESQIRNNYNTMALNNLAQNTQMSDPSKQAREDLETKLSKWKAMEEAKKTPTRYNQKGEPIPGTVEKWRKDAVNARVTKDNKWIATGDLFTWTTTATDKRDATAPLSSKTGQAFLTNLKTTVESVVKRLSPSDLDSAQKAQTQTLDQVMTQMIKTQKDHIRLISEPFVCAEIPLASLLTSDKEGAVKCPQSRFKGQPISLLAIDPSAPWNKEGSGQFVADVLRHTGTPVFVEDSTFKRHKSNIDDDISIFLYQISSAWRASFLPYSSYNFNDTIKNFWVHQDPLVGGLGLPVQKSNDSLLWNPIYVGQKFAYIMIYACMNAYRSLSFDVMYANFRAAFKYILSSAISYGYFLIWSNYIAPLINGTANRIRLWWPAGPIIWGILSFISIVLRVFGGYFAVVSNMQSFNYGMETNIRNLYIPIVLGAITPLLSMSGVLLLCLPVLPFVIYSATVCGWFVVVLESLFALPIIALGIAHPKGHDLLGRAEKLLILVVGLFIRPVAIVIGFVFSILLSYGSFWFLNNIFVLFVTQSDFIAIQSSATQYSDYFKVLILLLFYVYVCIKLVTGCFGFTYRLPAYLVRWIGGQPNTALEEQAVSEFQQGVQEYVDVYGKAVSGEVQSAQAGGDMLSSYINQQPQSFARGAFAKINGMLKNVSEKK